MGQTKAADQVQGSPDPPTSDTATSVNSMTLLTSMLERPLDPSYEAAAKRRLAAGLPAATSSRSPIVIISALLVGLVLAISAADLRSRAAIASPIRSDLLSRVESQRAQLADSSRTVSSLNAEIGQAQQGLASGTTKQLTALGGATGLSAVTGPGIIVTLDDAQQDARGGNGPRSTTNCDTCVNSTDLQLIANYLWEAGAEAISINGQRLTSTSAIRFAGQAVLVNFRPLQPPYQIDVLGDPQTLQSQFALGDGGSYISALQGSYGIRATINASDQIAAPAAITGALRYASPITGSKTP